MDNAIPNFLTIRQTAETKILNEFRLRKLCAEGKLPGFYAGRKFMVNFPALCDQLNQVGREKERA